MNENTPVLLNYDYVFAFLSILTAFITSFACFVAAHSVKQKSKVWYTIIGTTLGLGIWTTLYVGTASINFPEETTFAFNSVFVSLFIMIGISIFAISLAYSDTQPIFKLGFAGLLLGSGASMLQLLFLKSHTLEAQIHFEPIYLISAYTAAVFISIYTLYKTRCIIEQHEVQSAAQLMTSSLFLTLGLMFIHFIGSEAIFIYQGSSGVLEGSTEDANRLIAVDSSHYLYASIVAILLAIIAYLLKYILNLKSGQIRDIDDEVNEFSAQTDIVIQSELAEKSISGALDSEWNNSENNSEIDDLSDDRSSPLDTNAVMDQIFETSDKLKKDNARFLKEGDSSQLYNDIVNNITQSTDAGFGTFIMLDNEGKIRKSVSQGVNKESEKLLIDLIQDERFVDIQDNGVVVDHKGLQEDSRFSGFNKGQLDIQSLMIQPVKNENGTTGFIVLGNKESESHFSRDDEALATLYAREVGQTIRNNRIVSQLKRRSKELENEKLEKHKLKKHLKNAKVKLAHARQAASRGQIATGVTNEIYAPASNVNSNMKNIDKQVKGLVRVLDTYEEKDHLFAEHETAMLEIEKTKEEVNYKTIKQEVIENIDYSKADAKKIKESIDELRDHVSKDESKWELSDLHSNIDKAIDKLGSLLTGKIKVIRRYGSVPNFECLNSPITQVFQNILENAAQAIDKEGMIEISTGSENNGVWVKILDTGRGIEADNIKRLFDPFFTTTDKEVGIGLSQANDIIKRHQGNINIESQLGTGTAVTISLPISQKQLKNAV